MELIGKKIVEFRKLTEKELKKEYWESTAKVSCIVFDDGSKIYPSRDLEGNGPGEFFYVDKEGEQEYCFAK